MTRRGVLPCAIPACIAAALALPGVRAGAAGLVTVMQAHRAFGVPSVQVKRGDVVRFTNDDAFNHQVYVKSPGFSFHSAEQAPGEAVNVTFPTAGSFDVLCEIHPRMRLSVTVD